MHNFIVDVVLGSQHLLIRWISIDKLSLEEKKGPEKAASNMHISNTNNNRSSQLKYTNTETFVMQKF